MTLQVLKKANGRQYLSIVHAYRDTVTKKVRHKSVKSLGYVDELKKEYADPIGHFKQVVIAMNEAEKKTKAELVIRLNRDEKLELGSINRKNIGYVAISKIYHELGLDVFLSNKSRVMKCEYSVNSIMKLLIYSRILAPGSKKAAHEDSGKYFEKFDFSLADIYRCLEFMSRIKEDIEQHIHSKIAMQYGRNTEMVYYDVTNYYFEIDEQDELRRKGVSKEHRPDPIVQMGLFMDADGIPMAYRLFPGNTNDCETLLPMIADIKKGFNIGRMIVVADKGLNTGNNIAYTLAGKDGYVYSQTVRGGNQELKDYVLDDRGYKWIGEKYKIKSRIYPREITFVDIHGKSHTERVPEKQIIFYSHDYDKRAKAERAPALQKALAIEGSPSKYNRATSYGAAKYLKNLAFDKKTGEIITNTTTPVFDITKQRSEELFDGYYAIVTSEVDKSDDDIIEIYRGLWRIEETFKVTKSDLEARPVYLSRKDRIEAHFLICFVALVITRLLQRRLGNSFSVPTIIDSLSKISCSHITENIYLCDHIDDVSIALSDKLGIPLNSKYLLLSEIKNIIANSKKS